MKMKSTPKHVLLFDEETGQDVDWILFNCHYCGSKHSVFTLGYYKQIKKHGKLYRKLQADDNNYYCIVCDFQSDPKKQSEFVKRHREESKKDNEKLRRFPDEQMANVATDIRIHNPEFTQLFEILIHNTSREQNRRIVDILRNSRLYRNYPKSLLDDDRLLMAGYGYLCFIMDKAKAKDGSSLVEELAKVVLEDYDESTESKK